MKYNNTVRFNFGGGCLILAFLCILFLFGVKLGIKWEQQDAVKAGHAEYYLDENNNRQWRWKEGR